MHIAWLEVCVKDVSRVLETMASRDKKLLPLAIIVSVFAEVFRTVTGGALGLVAIALVCIFQKIQPGGRRL